MKLRTVLLGALVAMAGSAGPASAAGAGVAVSRAELAAALGVLPNTVAKLLRVSAKNGDELAVAARKLATEGGEDVLMLLLKSADETEAAFRKQVSGAISEMRGGGRLDYVRKTASYYGDNDVVGLTKMIQSYDSELPPEAMEAVRSLMHRSQQAEAYKKISGGELGSAFKSITDDEVNLFKAWRARMEALDGRPPILSRRTSDYDRMSGRGSSATQHRYIMSNEDSAKAYARLQELAAPGAAVTKSEADEALRMAMEFDQLTAYERKFLELAAAADTTLARNAVNAGKVSNLIKKARDGAEFAEGELDVVLKHITDSRRVETWADHQLNEQLDELVNWASRNPHLKQSIADVQLARSVTGNRSWLKLRDEQYEALAEAIELGDKGTKTQKMLAATRGQDHFKESAEVLEELLRKRFIKRLGEGVSPRTAEETKWLREAAEAGPKGTELQKEMVAAAAKNADSESGKMVARLGARHEMHKRLSGGAELLADDAAEVRRIGAKPTAELTDFDKEVLRAARKHKATEQALKELDLERTLRDGGRVWGDNLRHVIDALETPAASRTPLQKRLAEAAVENPSVKEGVAALSAKHTVQAAPRFTKHFEDLAEQSTKGLKVAGELFDRPLEIKLRVALAQGRYEAFAVLDELPVAAKALMDTPTSELLGLATQTLNLGKGVGPGLRDVAKAVQGKAAGTRSAAEAKFLAAWRKQYPNGGGAFTTPAGLIMGKAESEAALGLIKKLQKMKKEGGLKGWNRLGSSGHRPFNPVDKFTQVERDFIEQAYRGGGDTTFNQKVRELVPKNLMKDVNGAVNPFPTHADVLAAKEIVSGRAAWLSGSEDAIDTIERIGRMQSHPMPAVHDAGLYDPILKKRYANDREMFSIKTELRHMPTSQRYARDMDPAAVTAGTLNPMPSAADVATFTKEWNTLTNSLRGSVKAKRAKVAELRSEYYKANAEQRAGLARIEGTTGRREQLASSEHNVWSGALTSAETDLRVAETQLANVLRMSPEEFATRFPPAGNAGALKEALSKAEKAAAQYAKEVAAEAKDNADSFAARVKATLATLDEQLAARGVAKDALENAPSAAEGKALRELLKSEQQTVDEAMAIVAELEKRADGVAHDTFKHMNLDNLDNPTRDAMLNYEKLNDVQSRNDAILAAKQRVDDALERVTSYKPSAKQLDEYAEATADKLATRTATLATRKAKWSSMKSTVTERLEKVTTDLPAAEQRLGMYRTNNMAEKAAKHEAYVAALKAEQAALGKAKTQLAKLDDASFEDFDKVDKVYDDVVKIFDALPAPSAL